LTACILTRGRFGLFEYAIYIDSRPWVVTSYWTITSTVFW
jgi:hypothetical protein